MAKAAAYTKTGNKQAETVTLDKTVFDVAVNSQIVDLAYRSYLSASRSAGAKTLTRGDVRGGGKKPWRQKGTGRARAGSSRIPHWTGGGVAFGNTGQENYAIKLPDKVKRAAIRQALSAQAVDGRVSLIETLQTDGKTKSAAQLLGKLEAEGNVLLVVDALTDEIDRSTRNLAGVYTVPAQYLNVFIVLNADRLIITKPALDTISQWLGTAKAAPAVKVADKPDQTAETAK